MVIGIDDVCCWVVVYLYGVGEMVCVVFFVLDVVCVGCF